MYGPPLGTVTLKATCDTQHKVVGWVQCTGVGDADPTFTNENPATLLITGYASPRFVSANYETPPLTSVTFCAGSEGGMVFGCESHQWWPVFAKTVSLPDTSPFMCAAALTYPGFEFDRWDTPGLESAGPYAWDLRAAAFSTVKALFKSANEYVLTAETELEEGGDGTCAGYLTEYPAQKYYQSGNKVRLTPHPNPGYVFASWQGNGEATDGLPVDKHPMMSDFFHSEEGFLEVSMDKDRTVTAVFDKMKAVTLMGGSCTTPQGEFSTYGSVALPALGFDTNNMGPSTPVQVREELIDPACVVFAEHCHGSQHGIQTRCPDRQSLVCVDSPRYVGGTPLSLPPSHPGYALVYLLSCHCGESIDAWKSAFKAQCVIGWTGVLNSGINSTWWKFDRKFWMRIQYGRSAVEALTRSYAEIAPLLTHGVGGPPLYEPWDERDEHVVIVGDTRLKDVVCAPDDPEDPPPWW